LAADADAAVAAALAAALLVADPAASPAADPAADPAAALAAKRRKNYSDLSEQAGVELLARLAQHQIYSVQTSIIRFHFRKTCRTIMMGSKLVTSTKESSTQRGRILEEKLRKDFEPVSMLSSRRDQDFASMMPDQLSVRVTMKDSIKLKSSSGGRGAQKVARLAANSTSCQSPHTQTAPLPSLRPAP
jgi:hypothetical protein